jgi:CO dehydrogenase nickel-insertion accessory protein CooC1
LLDYFGGGAVTYPMDDPMPLIRVDLDIDDLPEAYYGRSPDGIQFFVAGKMGGKGPGARCDRPIAEIVRDFRPRYEGQQPVTLVDFRAGFDDSTRRSIVNLDWNVVVIDPTMAAVQMAINMQEIVNQIRVGEGVFFVLNRVHDALTERFLRSRLAEEGIEPLGVIPETPALAMAWLLGEPLIKTPAQEEAEWIVKQLETAVNHMTTSADKYDKQLARVTRADDDQNNPSPRAWPPRSGRNVAIASKRPLPESFWY